MSAQAEHEYLQAEARYYKEQIALLRAKLYRWGQAPNAHMRELEEKLSLAERRVAASRARAEDGAGPDRR